jgi:hypothetical protein
MTKNNNISKNCILKYSAMKTVVNRAILVAYEFSMEIYIRNAN